MSIFVDGKPQPGIYKIQNLASKTYLEVLGHSNELCCRPGTVLTPNDAVVSRNELPAFERLTHLILHSGNFKPQGQDTVSKRCNPLRPTHDEHIQKHLGVGLQGKAGSILQCIRRVRALRIRGRGLHCELSGGMEGRGRGRHPAQGIWMRSVSRLPDTVRRFNLRYHSPQR